MAMNSLWKSRACPFFSITLLSCFPGLSFGQTGLESVGDLTQVIVPAYALGMAANEDGSEGVTQWSYSFAATMATVYAIKSSLPVQRPDYEDGDRKDSFPSGHTAAAFSGATFIHRRYGLERAVGPYALAVFTGYTRIEAKRHRLGDVLVGASIATAWTWALVDEKAQVQVSVDGKKVGLRYVLNLD